MNSLKRLKQALRDDRGQAVTEYILLLSAVLTGAIFLGRALIKVFDDGVLFLGGQLEKDLKTGRQSINGWIN